jgi:hypothetical protein
MLVQYRHTREAKLYGAASLMKRPAHVRQSANYFRIYMIFSIDYQIGQRQIQGKTG